MKALVTPLHSAYPSLAHQAESLNRQINRFVTGLSERDVVLIVDGKHILGIG